MSTRVVDRVDGWESQSFTGGYRELTDLADREFSGVVRAGGAELYMTKGVVVGIQRGDIEDFEGVSGTVYEAPSPALPMLAVMQENSDEVRDKFYSEKASISEVDRTLSGGNFTGYIELSENVLSGDYYLVYHSGESMSVAFVGQSQRLIDGDEAFRTADDEVGIYEVRPAEIEPVELPEPSEPEPEPASAEPDTEPQTDQQNGSSHPTEREDEPAQTGDQLDGSPHAGDQQDESTHAGDRQEETGRSPATRQQDERGQGAVARQRDPAENEQVSDSGDGTAESVSRTEQRNEADATATEGQPESIREQDSETSPAGQRTQSRQRSKQRPEKQPDADDETGRQHPEQTDRQHPEQAEQSAAASQSARETGQSPPQEGTAREEQRDASQQRQASARTPESSSSATGIDMETRAIPSLDPARTEIPEPSRERRDERTDTGRSQRRQQRQDHQSQQSQTPGEPPRQPRHSQGEPAQQTADPAPTDADEPADQSAAVDTERIETLESELDERETELSRLELELDERQSALESARDEREQLQEELDAVRAERDELEAERERLEDQLRQLETELGAATDAERRMTPGEALTGTDVFIRYHSKGDATLEKAHAGSGRREDVNENLRLENHTQFEKHAVSINGKTYDEFLDGRLEYQFVEWVVRDLLFEIRETGHDKQLRDLYDILPQLDRAELAGVVDVVYTEDGQETRTQESFDVILRNRMGNPLLVANLNDSREAATESMMERLITSAERVGQSSDEFAGAFMVTSSFFDPGALEMADQATKGGLLSRDKRKSFVNLSRKRGYHLCLVEARNRNFHLAVPEL